MRYRGITLGSDETALARAWSAECLPAPPKGFYDDPAVQARIREFVGYSAYEEAVPPALREVSDAGESPSYSMSDLPRLLRSGAEIERSLWDPSHVIADLDLEYVNHDFPGEPFLDPIRAFTLQRPVVRAIQEVLGEAGIFPLHLLSGRGHHFVWSFKIGGSAYRRLAAIGPAVKAAGSVELRPSEALERAYAGLGMALEWLAHRVKCAASSSTDAPIQLTDVRVGSGERGREAISLDLSEYGDPLHTRFLRIPYSYYRKPSLRPDIYGRAAAESPELIEIPLFEMDECQGLEVMRDPAAAARLARRAGAKIPEAGLGTGRLVDAYLRSPLAAFHRDYYAKSEDSRDVEADARSAHLPHCAASILEFPNDRLLQPAGIQHVVRVLMSLGWSPRRIARLVQTKFEQDHGWGERWRIYNPAVRADFYTRLFAGMIVCGGDRLIDFNSVSHIEKGCCSDEECCCDLRDYQRSLLERKDHERMGRRPFNRLFSLPQHL